MLEYLDSDCKINRIKGEYQQRGGNYKKDPNAKVINSLKDY